ncbi:hypothetical protein [Helicobacter sp.]|uniref:hypothetical protein n=1 Tax=Helicobacter sp. TaxID=218 RepID=UPI0025877DEC|nr:hypothetical protein [Helicobacter sp.]MCI7047699.1 hypothetical protein [Helicobacter sp.]MDY4425991.1 hypothetical protein [Helicobacter sp.]MDY5615708.1 hypothetical protein [Helicobacter sp.]
MKISKILFLFIFFANYSLAGVWSHMGINGIDGAYSSINASISVREEAVRAIWASQINPLLQSIRNNTTEKKMLLEQISELEKKINISQKNKVFLLEQEKKLLGKLIEIEAVAK